MGHGRRGFPTAALTALLCLRCRPACGVAADSGSGGVDRGTPPKEDPAGPAWNEVLRPCRGTGKAPDVFTFFTQHLGHRVHAVTFSRPGRYLLHLVLSVQRAGGVLNALGTCSDVAPAPPEFKIDASKRKDMLHTFAYGGADDERGYRQILFKRLLFVWRLSARLPPEDLLLYVDGNDVLFQRPMDAVVAEWHQLTAADPPGKEAVIFMGYPTCQGRFEEGSRYPLPDGRYITGPEACGRWRRKMPKGTLRYLDTGGYIGRAAAVHAVLEDAVELTRLGHDYICMSMVMIAGLRLGPTKLRVDTEARIFYSMRPRGPNHGNWTVQTARPLCRPGYFDGRGSPPPHAVTGRSPAVLHFVGHAKWYHFHRCLDTFLEQHKLELRRGDVWGSRDGVAAKDLPRSACRPLRYEDCGEGLGQSLSYDCVSCYNMGPSGVFGYYDLDRDDFMTYPLDRLDHLAA